MNKDQSHSWVRISHGLNNKEQDDNEQKTSEMQFEDYALKSDAGDFCKPIKGKSNHKNVDFASSSTRTFPIG